MRHVDIVPDWIIAVLVMFMVASVYSIFGGIGVVVLGIVATTIWIAQIIEGGKFHRDRDSGTGIAGIQGGDQEERQLGRPLVAMKFRHKTKPIWLVWLDDYICTHGWGMALTVVAICACCGFLAVCALIWAVL